MHLLRFSREFSYFQSPFSLDFENFLLGTIQNIPIVPRHHHPLLLGARSLCCVKIADLIILKSCLLFHVASRCMFASTSSTPCGQSQARTFQFQFHFSDAQGNEDEESARLKIVNDGAKSAGDQMRSFFSFCRPRTSACCSQPLRPSRAAAIIASGNGRAIAMAADALATTAEVAVTVTRRTRRSIFSGCLTARHFCSM